SSTPQPEAFAVLQIQTVSSHKLDQPGWAVQLVRKVGELALSSEGVKALVQRSAFRAVQGRPAGIEGSIAKLVVAEHAHQVGDYAFELLAEEAAFADGTAEAGVNLFLQCRMATIAGGTSEVLRNLLAERALGLPREP
ncbi:acyl-CoA dehydrogenase family protein, partial [Streptomyces sp. NPDC056296]|uniref:acyl-CoA dehydrogenase family protein n=1 Tax=Streptomyces sp. NPDC056296 TaxID=3345775 RepID=UPI0035DEF6B0